MPDDETLNRRLRAVERTLSDGDHDVDALREAGVFADRVEALESQLADAETRIDELESVTQALRGYVGNVRSVNEEVEQRADAALAAVERLEQQAEYASRDESAGRRSPLGRSESGPNPSKVPDSNWNDADSGPMQDGDTEVETLFDRVRNAFR